MTDPDRMAVWLREAMDAAERDAEAAGGDDWRRQDHPSDTVAIYDSTGEPVVYDEGSPTEAQQAHIVRYEPAAVLRQIDRHRKLLYEHGDDGYGDCKTCSVPDGTVEVNGVGYEMLAHAPSPCTTVRLLAEGYGWKENDDV